MASSKIITQRLNALVNTEAAIPKTRKERINEIVLTMHFCHHFWTDMREIVCRLSEYKLFLTMNPKTKLWTVFTIPTENIYKVITNWRLDKPGIRREIATMLVDFQDDLANVRKQYQQSKVITIHGLKSE